MTGVVIVGTGFGCITHLRALRAAGFDVHALVGRDPDEDRASARGASTSRTASPTSPTRSRSPASTRSRSPRRRTRTRRSRSRRSRPASTCCARSRSPATREEAQPMLDAAEAAGVVHLLGTEFRWSSGPGVDGTRRARAARSARRSSRRSCCTSRCSPTPRGEVPGWWADAAQGGGWLGAQAAHVVDQVRVMLGEIDGVSASLTQVSRARLGRRRQRTPCTSAPARASTASCRARSARGDRRCSAPASPATAERCGPSSTPCASPTRPARARSRRPTTSRSRRPIRRPAICSPPRTTASTRSASTWRRTRACARRSSTSSRAARCPTIRRRRPSPTASPACRCSTRSAARPASTPGSTIEPA